jgi:hypothetical protein
VFEDKYVKISIDTGISQHPLHIRTKKKKKKRNSSSNVYCQRRSDDAGMYSVTGRAGIPDIKTDATALVFELANGTN